MGINSRNFISVICPIYNEKKYINKFLESLLAQDYPYELMEVLLVDGISTDNTREIIKAFAEKHKFVKLLDNPNKIVPYALNIGIKASVGDIIIRIDAHCEYPVNYLSILVENLNLLNTDNVGGIIHTKSANSSAISNAIATALNHQFGVGNSLYRIGQKKTKQVDTVPFGCFRRTIFDQIGFFDTDLVRNQDDEFNGRIIKNGGRIHLIPDIEITYYARDSIYKVGQMFYQYGLFKPLVNKKIGSPTSFRQFIPFLFVFGIILGSILSPFIKPVMYISLIFIFIYISISIIFSLFELIKQRSINNLLLPIIFLTIHTSYGFGYILGIFRFLILGKNSAKLESSR